MEPVVGNAYDHRFYIFWLHWRIHKINRRAKQIHIGAFHLSVYDYEHVHNDVATHYFLAFYAKIKHIVALGSSVSNRHQNTHKNTFTHVVNLGSHIPKHKIEL